MPCHYTFKEGNYYGMSSVIGTQISHAVGAAMAARLRGDDVVVLGYLGDGATSANDFHSGMNFAAVYQSPCVLLCQNNQALLFFMLMMQKMYIPETAWYRWNWAAVQQEKALIRCLLFQ